MFNYLPETTPFYRLIIGCKVADLTGDKAHHKMTCGSTFAYKSQLSLCNNLNADDLAICDSDECVRAHT